MNEELSKAISRATDWYMHPDLYGALREMVMVQLLEELPEKDGLLLLNPLAMHLHSDPLLPSGMVALFREKECIGTIKFEQGSVAFAVFKKAEDSDLEGAAWPGRS